MKLEELKVYQLAMDIGQRIWEIVIKWDFFAKDTIGKQLVRAADSVAANLSEAMDGFITRKTGNFVIMAEGLFTKP